ncbi:MAG: DUF547 domain-containing protein [Ferruginibacter sp.]|nr:DUF547 domain-containing protein [Cytophagales bacterium]
MKRSLSIIFGCCLLFVRVPAADLPAIDHTPWDKLLKAHVSASGKVDYKGFVKDKAQLDAYLQSLSKVKPDQLAKEERLAFWINAYNAYTVDVIVRNYPVKSILDVRTNKSLVGKVAGDKKVFVEKLRYPIDGKEYSLYKIEKDKLLGELFDPRIHFAINCASFSCPKLLNEAYVPAKLEAQLDAQTKSFVNDPTKNKLSANNPQLSQIFDWYQKDFTRNGNVIAYLNRYADQKIDPAAKIAYINYDWKLNE